MDWSWLVGLAIAILRQSLAGGPDPFRLFVAGVDKVIKWWSKLV